MSTDTPRPASGADCDSATFGQQLLAAFDAVADVPPAQREAAIQALGLQCPELERELRALLDRDARTGPLDATLSGQIQPLLQEALPELDPAPAQIGPYAVLRLLGEGGMGRVYLARRSDGPVSRDVAIKLIRPDRAGAGLLARFEAERRHLAALDHPGICRFIDADSLADGTPYVVMEAVQGEPIIDYCQRHGLGLRARVELLRTLLAAVAHAHDRLLLHRDIKPHNVLVTADGQPKLLDFGIAKSIEDAQASVTRTAERFFTPNASAPEQLLGEPAGVACDVYSLGALAYELLSGALPFDFNGLRAAEIERLVLQVAPPLMSERSTLPWARELKGDLDAIVATCLRKAPGERYRNVDALDAELQRWLEGRPVTARAPSWAYRSRLFVRRHRVAVGLSAALVSAVTALGLALQMEAQRSAETARLLQEMFLSSEGDGLAAYSMDLSKFFARATARAVDDTTLDSDKRIELLQVLATRNLELNDVTSAELASRAALRIATNQYGHNSLQHAHAADRLARILLYSTGGRATEEAAELLEASAKSHSRNSPPLDHQIVHHRARALLGQFTDDHELMIGAYSSVLSLLKSDKSATQQQILDAQADFSTVLSIAGRQKDAIEAADAALAGIDSLLDREPSPQNKDLWRVIANTACEQRARQPGAVAVPICQRVLADLAASNELMSRAGAGAYLWLGNALAAEARFEEALTAYSGALNALKQIEGESTESVDYYRIRLAIGRLLLQGEKPEQATSHLDSTLRFFESRYSPTHRLVVPIRIDLLEALSRTGKLDPTNPLLRQDFDPDEISEANLDRWEALQAPHAQHPRT